MRVLFVAGASGLGGAERSLLDLVASLRAGAPEVALDVVVPGDGPLVAAAGDLGATPLVLPLAPGLRGFGDDAGRAPRALAAAAAHAMAGLGAARAVRDLRALVAARRPSVVHTNGVKPHLVGAAAALGLAPVVWHVRDYLGARRRGRLALRAAGALVGRAVAPSRSVAEDARRVAPGLRVEVVENAIDVDAFAPGPGDGARLDALAGLAPAPPDVVRVGLVGTYAHWKGHDVLFDAWTRLAPDLPALRLYVVGGPIYATAGSQWTEADLRARARARGVAAEFVPFQPDPAWVYRALDVVVNASTAPESFGRTIVEAMACGRAVIAPTIGGAAEVYADGEDALGVAPRDAAGLARAITSLAGDPARRAALGRAARATAARRFARPRLCRDLLAAYVRLGIG